MSCEIRQAGQAQQPSKNTGCAMRSMKRKENEGRIEMNDIPIGIAASEGVALTVITHLKDGKIDDAIAHFAEEFRFKDHGIGLEFKDKERFAEFLHKVRDLYPDSLLLIDTIFVSGDDVITESTL